MLNESLQQSGARLLPVNEQRSARSAALSHDLGDSAEGDVRCEKHEQAPLHKLRHVMHDAGRRFVELLARAVR